MKVQCDNCKAKYNISDDKIPDGGTKIKCPKCQSVISIMKTAKSSSHSSVRQPVQNDNHINKQAKLNNKNGNTTKSCPIPPSKRIHATILTNKGAFGFML